MLNHWCTGSELMELELLPRSSDGFEARISSTLPLTSHLPPQRNPARVEFISPQVGTWL